MAMDCREARGLRRLAVARPGRPPGAVARTINEIRKAIAFLPIIAFAIAFAHHIPLPPEIVFLGDALAYLDVLTILLFLAAVGRAGAIAYFVRRMAEDAARRLATMLAPAIRRTDSRHRRANSATGRKRRAGSSAKTDDDGLVWFGAPA